MHGPMNIKFMKILPVEIELFHAYRRTDMTKLIVAFLKFSNAPKVKKNDHSCVIKRTVSFEQMREYQLI